mgnify:CR=1
MQVTHTMQQFTTPFFQRRCGMTIWTAYAIRKEEERKAREIARHNERKTRAKVILGI